MNCKQSRVAKGTQIAGRNGQLLDSFYVTCAFSGDVLSFLRDKAIAAGVSLNEMINLYVEWGRMSEEGDDG